MALILADRGCVVPSGFSFHARYSSISDAVGIDTDPAGTQARYAWSRSRGYGAENWSRIIDAIRPYA